MTNVKYCGERLFGADPIEIDDVGENLAVETQCPPVMIGGKSGRSDHGVRRRERPGAAITKVVKCKTTVMPCAELGASSGVRAGCRRS